MSLLNCFKSSAIITPRLMFQKKEYRNSIPHVSENFAIACSILEDCDYDTLDSLPVLDSTLDQLEYNINKSESGVYKLRDQPKHILFTYRIKPSEFRYVVFYNSGLLQKTPIADKLCGFYLIVFQLTSDGLHFESTAFSYLVRPKVIDTFDILPLLTLEPSIPDYVSFQWPFLAMRNFNKIISDDIQYKYLATETEEIELLKKVGLYD